MKIISFSLALPFLAAAHASNVRGAKPVFDYSKYSNNVDLAEEAASEVTAHVFNYAKYQNNLNVDVELAEGEDEDEPLIFSRAKFEDNVDFEDGEDDDGDDDGTEDVVDNGNDDGDDDGDGDLAEGEDEDEPLIFSRAKFEDNVDFEDGEDDDGDDDGTEDVVDNGNDDGDDDGDGDLAEGEDEDEPLIFSRAKFEDNVDFEEGEDDDDDDGNDDGNDDGGLAEEELFNYKKYAIP